MRESLERIGRFDPQRARQRLLDSFDPSITWFIESNGVRVGFYAFRPDGDGLSLDHLYIHPDFQGKGIGGSVLEHLFSRSGDKTIRVGALKQSDSNRFYKRHGFRQVGESEWDIEYVRP